MRIIFKTNLDRYQVNCFPENLQQVPRKGDLVLVKESFFSYFSEKKLPLRLEVVSVTWLDGGAICELWYNETDLKIAKESKADVF